MKRIGMLIALIFICYILISCGPDNTYFKEDKVKCEMISAIDGDTLYVIYEGEKTKVRLIGIDAPESVHTDESKNNKFGVMASDYMKELLEDIDYVYLEFDAGLYDDYDRLLAYVYTSNEQGFEECLNYKLAYEGYAINKEFAPNIKYADVLESACKDAEINQNGLWELEGIEDVFK